MQARSTAHAQGIDVSHWQGTIDWTKVKASGKSFVFIKATEGTSYTDPQFVTYVKGARAAGLLVGAYHFTRASKPADVAAEVAYFLTTLNLIGGVASLDLPAVLDAETKEAGTPVNITATIRAWVDEFKRRTGKLPFLYTYPSFIDAYLNASLGDVPLWYAYYSSTVPANKAGWNAWEFMQYSSEGSVNGISGSVDMNEYRGTLADLKNAYQKATTPIPNDPPAPALQWKESGRQWLIEHAGISPDWKASDVIDIGTLGAILSKYMDKNSTP
ncbi:lysozyme [Paenibacillus shirakamiensis]|uniref:Lysozyme n=1 Tax=Paenibacillus shirakamiensis TaxID=1265935 RepID=A0ABS4JHI5_9BACL|nr:glycoside hydrolase family 25 protein [Paenibacillus shirakamiensis]MBP2001185.1 lysozyme [Paenibacillus shirakamiensis]